MTATEIFVKSKEMAREVKMTDRSFEDLKHDMKKTCGQERALKRLAKGKIGEKINSCIERKLEPVTTTTSTSTASTKHV